MRVPPNEKGQDPNTSAVFSGIQIDTLAGDMDIYELQREYIIQRINDLLSMSECRCKDLTSVYGSLV